ncbi:MAG: signal peptidase I [Ignavibacteriales bacterium]|nr:signal peptidase I [Ignavibacteriales bacterium]
MNLVPTDRPTDAPRRRGRGATIAYLKAVALALAVVLAARAFVFEAYRIPTSSMKNTLQPGDFIVVNKLVYLLSDPARNDVIVFDSPRSWGEDAAAANYVKRVVGAPGDTVRLCDKRALVNGEPLPIEGAPIFFGRPRSAADARDGLFPEGARWNEDQYGPVVAPKRGDLVRLSAENWSAWRAVVTREAPGRYEIRDGVVLRNGIPLLVHRVREDYYFVLGDNRDDSLDSRYWGFVPRSAIQGRAEFVYWSREPGDGFFAGARWERVLKSVE